MKWTRFSSTSGGRGSFTDLTDKLEVGKNLPHFRESGYVHRPNRPHIFSGLTIKRSACFPARRAMDDHGEASNREEEGLTEAAEIGTPAPSGGEAAEAVPIIVVPAQRKPRAKATAEVAAKAAPKSRAHTRTRAAASGETAAPAPASLGAQAAPAAEEPQAAPGPAPPPVLLPAAPEPAPKRKPRARKEIAVETPPPPPPSPELTLRKRASRAKKLGAEETAEVSHSANDDGNDIVPPGIRRLRSSFADTLTQIHAWNNENKRQTYRKLLAGLLPSEP